MLLLGCWVIELVVFGDECGFFFEIWNVECFQEQGLLGNFVQSNVLFFVCGVLCGLYYQWLYLQGKLVIVLEGEVYDVVVDICRGLLIFGCWEVVVLSVENRWQFWILEGFVYGFVVLFECVLFSYLCMDVYVKEVDVGICWNDVDIVVDWLVSVLILLVKDENVLFLKDVVEDCLLVYVL